MRRRGKWLLPRPAISGGILLKARNAQKATVDPMRRVSRVKVGRVFVCVCVCICMHAEEGGGGKRVM